MFGGKGGMGGGGVALRTAGRAVTKVGVGGVAAGGGGVVAGLQESLSSATVNGSSSSTSRSTSPRRSHLSVEASPVSSVSSYQKSSGGIPIWDSGSAECEEYEWVAVEKIEDEGFCGYGFHGHYILGYPPSEDEVEDAVFALQNAFGTVKHVRDKYKYELENDGSDQLDWVEPSFTPYGPRTLHAQAQAQGSEGVSYAFRLLQSEPSVQRMVKSLSSDKAVWNAVLNNEAVRELRESIFEDEEHSSESQDGTSEVESGTTANIVVQIFHSAKSKFMEVIETIAVTMNGLFQPANQKTTTEAEPEPEAESEPCGRFNKTVRIVFMLSVAVMLVVVGGRRAKSKREGPNKSSKA